MAPVSEPTQPVPFPAVREPLHVVFFGTYDETRHPRVTVLREGLIAQGHRVDVVNVPLDLDTAARVQLVVQPWRAPLVAARLVAAWARLLVRAPVPQPRCRGRRLPRPPRRALGPTALATDAPRRRSHGVARGHGDRPPARPVIADHPPSGPGRPCGDPAGRHGGRRHRPTARPTPPRPSGQGRGRAGGCPEAWFDAARPPLDRPHPLSVVFFGVYTPLQGTTVIGEAIAKLEGLPVSWTMIGTGQDRARCEAATGDVPVRWIDWASGRAAVPGGVTRRLPRHLRHRPQGPPSRSEQGLPRCRRRVRDRHLRHTRTRGARRGRHLRPTRRRRRPERGHHEPEQEPVRRRHRPRRGPEHGPGPVHTGHGRLGPDGAPGIVGRGCVVGTGGPPAPAAQRRSGGTGSVSWSTRSTPRASSSSVRGRGPSVPGSLGGPGTSVSNPMPRRGRRRKRAAS